MDDYSLADGFRAVARRMREAARQALAPWDVTPAQARALGTLLRAGPLRLGDLAEALRIAPRSATEVVDALEGRGLVERAPDPADRRATLVAPTPRGAEVGTAIRAARAAEAEGMFRDLSETDRAHLARILRTLAPP
ncbi:MarR family winged helix-turn-helix transcriptional regulator [Pseudonocardia hydrocarbonoxydans]|uniref:MarR family transcriptional regulator n=1 Tax=Pseudonocardia hydrocarbonoxydans TaxID=76726 RepID=A0A4Y3WIX4_9PSEU|nr:MarR family transcriptional regulator [Pseudonocardia hydrocarbonoxydans]GEC18201.1 MarR family transcriptional regulator [Pseudonocardia hydrocarbonoxydans]